MSVFSHRSLLSSDNSKLSGGCFVAVVGPSGAGKDTLMRGLKERFASDRRFIFARRIITRKSDSTEDHDTVSQQDFDRMKAEGAFLLAWFANGLHYGIPSGLARDLTDGGVIIANVSRMVLPEIRHRFQRHFVVEVTAQPEILAARLSARAREDLTAQQARLDRAFLQTIEIRADITIDNSHDLGGSLNRFEQALKSVVFPLPLGL